MPPLPAHFEPATRNPRNLRITAFILVGIMLLGGVLVLLAYQRWTHDQVKDERPAFDGGRLTEEKDLPLIRQDGSRAGLFDLAGKVSLIQATSAADPASSALTTAVMRRLAARYAGNPDCVLVSLVLDPGPAEHATATLKAAAAPLDATLPQWWVATTDPDVLRKYIKKELKASLYPEWKDGKWEYDTSIVVVDRNRHLRRPVVHQQRGGSPYVGPFDFDQAAGWDARGVKSGTGRTNVEELELLLIKTIDELLAEPLKTS
jgi:cytochrome oxidase Cu insertion factor (SCO1/SenC/PrrC family)